jgi:anaerobic selenocysteine-containing dehydrogenase
MQRTRREILLFMGGGAAGAMLTPAPWRLVTDAAIWSENWPGIPRPARGEITARYTNCALCPAGCAVRARCVAGQPVSLAGVSGGPLSLGALCAFGLTGHHLPYHPKRLKQGTPEEAAAAVRGAMAKCGPSENIAVLDLAPGRSASWTYRRAMAAVANGVYLAPPLPLGGAAVNLAKARIVLSLGAPLLDGWGTPGNVHAARANFRLVQAEPWESRTAALADEWLPIRPGSEAALALALTDPKTAASAAQATGLTEKQIAGLANELRANGPALVLSADDLPEAMALNQALGAWGQTLAAGSEAPLPDVWKKAAPERVVASVADNSIRVLFIDESVPGSHIPWSAVEKKLVRDNPVVVAFAWSLEGYGRHAQFTLPTAVYPELTGDIPPAVDSPAATFRIAAPLVAPPAGMTDPSAFIAKATGIDPGNALQERADAIYKSGQGTLFTYADAKSTPLKDLKPADFWKSLNEGGAWIANAAVGQDAILRGDCQSPRGPIANRPAGCLPANLPHIGSLDTAFPLPVAFSEPQSASLTSPLMSKLYQDSDLRMPPNTAALHPDTARASGILGAARAVLETQYGRCAIGVIPDASVPPGMLAVAAGAEVLDICGALTRAKVVAA